MPAPLPATPGDGLGQRLIRQRGLLHRLLRLAQHQRATLVAGHPVRLIRISNAMGRLVEEQTELCHHLEVPDGAFSPEVAREVVALAQELRRELHANYALSCHGAKLVAFPLALFAGAASPCGGLRLVDESG